MEDNRIAGPGTLLFHYGRAARDVTVARNRGEAGSWWLAALYNVDDAVVQDNLSSGVDTLVYLTDTRDAKLYRNTLNGGAPRHAVVLSGTQAPNRQTVIEGNDFGAGANGIAALTGSVAGTLAVRYNRFAPGTLGLLQRRGGLGRRAIQGAATKGRPLRPAPGSAARVRATLRAPRG